MQTDETSRARSAGAPCIMPGVGAYPPDQRVHFLELDAQNIKYVDVSALRGQTRDAATATRPLHGCVT